MRKNDLLLIIFIYIVFSFYSLSPRGDGELKIDIWDVGQGDSIYIETPRGKKILIDGGDNYQADFNISRKLPFYACYVDLLVLTHPHYDHIKGLNRILQRCKVGSIMFNDVDFDTRDFESFKDLSSNFNIVNGLENSFFEIDGVNFKILWPSKNFMQKKITDINDSSVVLFLDYGDFEALFTGDATEKVLGNIDFENIRSFIDGYFDLLKVPHHGSKYSLHKDFYSKLMPKKCIISVGFDNRFDHPSDLILDYFWYTGCEVLRTDESGDIKVKVQ